MLDPSIESPVGEIVMRKRQFQLASFLSYPLLQDVSCTVMLGQERQLWAMAMRSAFSAGATSMVEMPLRVAPWENERITAVTHAEQIRVGVISGICNWFRRLITIPLAGL